jgi:hypothetical protein
MIIHVYIVGVKTSNTNKSYIVIKRQFLEWSKRSYYLFGYGVHLIMFIITQMFYEKFEDTKSVIRIRKLKKDRQHNGQKKKEKSPWPDK